MEETIAAIGTALGNGSISIIRVSGSKAIEIVNEVFKNKDLTKVDSHTIHYGFIYDDNKLIDETMVSIFRSPKTYTKEDVVEINCHGGILVTKTILNLLLKKGCRLAQPGEFTKRAFLNGRIDLSQAEAVMDLINAKSNIAIRNSLNQISGKVKNKIVELREKIITYIAFIEAALDDPEHYEIDNYGIEIKHDIASIKEEVDIMIKDADNGKIIRDGINTAIIGLPNAGKSSLLNYLAKKERAIVTEIAGTTRDTIEERIVLDDIILNIIDTAGIRETEDLVEKIGVDRSLKVIEDSELVLYVIDSSKKLTDDNFKILEKLKNKNYIIILNKIDMNSVVDSKDLLRYTSNIVEISLIQDIGLDKLNKLLKDILFSSTLMYDDDIFIANERQKQLMINARESLNNVLVGIDNGDSEDFLTIDLTDAYIYLGKILGEEIEEDIIDKIFKDFCMGK